MLTPVDVQNKVFKGGIGFDKKDVEAFMEELTSDYSDLYRSNVELKDKVATLDESLQHYRTIEESVQKSLTISEKAAEETINAAKDKARQINIEAEKKAEAILADSKEELQQLKEEIFRLQTHKKQFISQYKKILNAQLQLCDGKVVDIDLGEGFDSSLYSDDGYGSLGSEGGLGGGGGYTGSYDDKGERPAGEPANNVGSLNIDPFADAKNGGGRFNMSANQKGSISSSGDGAKLSLNMKAGQTEKVKVKRSIPNQTPTSVEKDNATDNIKKEDKTSKKEAVKKDNSKKEAAKKDAAKKAEEKQEKARLEAERLQAQKDAEEAEKLAAAEALKEEAAKLEAEKLEVERKAREEAELKAKLEAEEQAKNEQIAQELFDKEFASVVNAVKEAARKQEQKAEEKDKENTQSINFMAMQRAKEKAAQKESEKEIASTDNNIATESDDVAIEGEVEDKVNESTMLDSEDNYSDGFDFISDDDNDQSGIADSLTFEEDEAFVGEVEDKVNESTMLDSEDNYSDGFDFIVEEEPSEEIPVINQEYSFSINSNVYSGEVEEKTKKSNLIGNDDDDDDGFNFL